MIAPSEPPSLKRSRGDCSRAIQSALKIVEIAKNRDIRCCVGVTTGHLLCAVVGSQTRSEYTVYGDAINLSARLMCKAKAGLGEILCDETTQGQASMDAQFVPLDPLPVKGKDDPVHVFRVEQRPAETNDRRRRKRHAPAQFMPSAVLPMVGRKHVMEVIVDKVENLMVGDGVGGCVVVEGSAGMGKSKVLFETQRSDFLGRGQEITVLYGASFAAHKSQTLFPWRSVFEEILTMDRALGTVHTGDKGGDGHKKGLAEKVGKLQAAETLLGRELGNKMKGYMEIWRKFMASGLNLEFDVFPISDTHAGAASDATTANCTISSLVRIAEFINVILGRGSESQRNALESEAYKQIRRAGCLEKCLSDGPSTRANEGIAGTQKINRRASLGDRPSGTPHRHKHSRPLATMSVCREIPRSPTAQGSNNSFFRSIPKRGSFHSFLELNNPLQEHKEAGAEDDIVWKKIQSRSSHEQVLMSTLRHKVDGTQEVRLQRLLELLVDFLECFVKIYGPVVLLIEDIQHFDSGSWALLNKLLEEGRGFVAVVTVSPSDGSMAPHTATAQVRQE